MADSRVYAIMPFIVGSPRSGTTLLRFAFATLLRSRFLNGSRGNGGWPRGPSCRAGGWRSGLTVEEKRAFQEVAGALLDGLGYGTC